MRSKSWECTLATAWQRNYTTNLTLSRNLTKSKLSALLGQTETFLLRAKSLSLTPSSSLSFNINAHAPLSQQEYLKSTKNIATQFLWSGKKSKIAYINLIQDISSSGLKLADLQTRVNTTHISWIKFIASNQDSLSARILSEITSVDEPFLLLLTKNANSIKFKQGFSHLGAILQTYGSTFRTENL